MDKEKKIIKSWRTNAANWIDVIEQNSIESRSLATNQAIENAICRNTPATVLDIGCGEGWLLKRLAAQDIKVAGIDAIPALIEKTKEKITGHFFVASYEEMARKELKFPVLFDIIVINFALLGKTSTEMLLPSLPDYLSMNGRLLIQTLHPFTRKQVNDYVTGWKHGSWDGLGDRFTEPYEWYFRTMEDWLLLLHQSGFNKIEITEVVHPNTRQALSVIFECITDEK